MPCKRALKLTLWAQGKGTLFLLVCIHMYMLGVMLARQISVSNEVYELLLEKKGKRSFSEVIKESLCSHQEKPDITSFAGALKDEKETLDKQKAKIAKEREANYGRPLK